ncbi:MAG: YkgJ family cysteine cluster protein [Phycisphaerales bacterium]|nr:YkgJ family cysteine cluster protein [Phycisphaerales bacterium]
MMVRLPIIIPQLPTQRYSCHSCGNCCRHFSVQLRSEDVTRLAEQGWERELGAPVTIMIKGVPHLRRQADGACVFLQQDGLCRIHARHGFDAKPMACKFFPFSLSPANHTTVAGLNFACQSVLENKGASPESHRRGLEQLADLAPECASPAGVAALQSGTAGTEAELATLRDSLCGWVTLNARVDKQTDSALLRRLDGLAWLAQTLSAATLSKVRGERFADLVQLLVGQLPQELPLHPVAPASFRQMALLRQSVFARLEDPALDMMALRGRLRTIWRQLRLNTRFNRARGEVPSIGLEFTPQTTFKATEATAPLSASSDAGLIDDLFSRWLMARIAGGRWCGSGYYGFDAVSGLSALVLDAACAGWIARCHAASGGRAAPSIIDARRGVMAVDRSAGRAPWLGGSGSRVLLGYLLREEGLRRVIRASV